MITDERLKAAAAEADQTILEALPLSEDCRHSFSLGFERKMKRLIRRKSHPVAYKFLQTAACILAVVILGGTTWLSVDTQARAMFFSWVKQTYESYVSYRFAGESSSEATAESYEPSWLPEGFTLHAENHSSNDTFLVYTDGKDDMISFMAIHGSESVGLFITSDYESVTPTMVGDVQGDYYKAEDPENANGLVWQSKNQDIIFCITAPLPKETLVKIAESVRTMDLDT